MKLPSADALLEARQWLRAGAPAASRDHDILDILKSTRDQKPD